MVVDVEVSGGAAAAHVAVDAIAHHVDLTGLLPDDRVVAVHWDGRDGEIQRISPVPGRRDIEYFADAAWLEPIVARWQIVKDEANARAAEQASVIAGIQAEAERQQAEQEKLIAEAAEARAALEPPP